MIQNAIPILEYDDCPQAVFMPDHEHFSMQLPRKAVFAFLGEAIDRYADTHNGRIVGEFVSITKKFPVYTVTYAGQEICLMQAPVGAPAAAQILDWLIAYGVREVISAGSCGVLIPMEENTFLIPCKALRDEGTSYHYLPPARYVSIPEKARTAIEMALADHPLRYTEVTTWSTDGFFRETREKVEYRVQEGCSAVEMECAALAACAQLRGAVFGQLMYTADRLADADHYDERNWGGDSVEFALQLCLDAVCNI